MPIRRTLKNVVKNYSDAQVKVREATSNDPWGPSSTLMSEIADLTYNVVAFTEIMQMVWKRLNDHGKNWRHVYKALVLLDYIIKTGSEKVAQQCRENIFAIQTLKDFQYVEDGKDHGMNVREKAKQLVSLLKDDERLKNERAKALKAKERFAQNTMGVGSTGSGERGMQYSTSMNSPSSDIAEACGNLPSHSEPGEDPLPTELEAARPSTAGEEELQLQLALAMSKEEADEDEKRRKGDEIKLQMALEESTKNDESPPPQGGTLLDLATGGHPPPANNLSGMNDIWEAPAPALPPKDPWGPPSPVMPPQPTLVAADNDPWSPPTAAAPVPAADPWSSPAAPALPARQSPWESPSPLTTNGNSGNVVEDEFDMISNRTKNSHDDFLGSAGNLNGSVSPSNDAWDMGAMNSSLPKDRSTTKSPADFLGENANLVNLDNLVSRPAVDNTNPFAMTTISQPPPSNPFGQQQQAAPRVPLNQMTTSSSMGFAAASQAPPLNNGSSSFMQQPIMPLGSQQPANNPFL
ncbi:hypothetical protein CAPTEDRAFT_21383 [Capitella teleta]|uniref:ENTH domain-containing protein n=1 Tax=Capitella teleta TaxID=283909 RepID=R7UTH4_CAPTE|nr:hypothetical protein CAPTEDRAFT_21383 [Capitella teleta]|eukprot:ELU09458.1 hypothetical protein CAPTEDRAFT_21383 [Capitella teleta]